MNLPPDERLRAEVGELLEDAGESPAPDVLDPILTHLRLLARWNEAYNLTRITEWSAILDRHVAEALLPLKYIGRDRGRFLDVGSGNGFPAIPILACRPQLCGVLLERSDKKGLFLDAVIREAAWEKRVSVDTSDAERFQAGPPLARLEPRRGRARPKDVIGGGQPGDDRGGAPQEGPAAGTREVDPSDGALFDYVISRATLAPEAMLRLALRWVRPGGRVFMYGKESAANVHVGGRRGVAVKSSARVGGRLEVVGNTALTGLGPGGVVSVELKRIALEPIPRRRDSYLYVLAAEAISVPNRDLEP